MIKESAVTDFQIARGNVERAVCNLLRRLAAGVPSGQHIVELGSYMGRTAGFLALGASEGSGATVTCVDPWELRDPDTWPEDYADGNARGGVYGNVETYQAFRDHMTRCGIDAKARGRAPVEIRRGTAVEVGHRWTGRVGLLWHDADHSADAVAADLGAWHRHVVPGGVVVLHDAGDRNYGVLEGAGRVLAGNPEWDWGSRQVMLWRKRPHRRGALIVRRVS